MSSRDNTSGKITYFYYREDAAVEEVTSSQFPLTLDIAKGQVHLCKGRLEEAVKSFNKVIERDSKNADALLARSKCFMGLMKYDLAMKDVESALKQKPNSYKVWLQKGEIEYIIGDFEFALLSFGTGVKLRPMSSALKFGLIKCRDAISNCIGPSSKLVVTNEDVKKVERSLRDETSVQTEIVLLNSNNVKQKRKMEYTARTLLGPVAVDKEFLQMILGNKSIQLPISNNNNDIENITRKGLDFLNVRQKFWQNIKPLHARDMIEYRQHTLITTVHRKVKEEQKTELPGYELNKKARKLLDMANDAHCECDDNTAAEYCLDVIGLIMGVSKRILPYKYELLVECFGVLGSAFYQLEEYHVAIQCHRHQLHMAVDNKIDAVYHTTLRNLYLNFLAIDHYENALRCLENLLEIVTTEIGKAYIYHELGHLHFLMGNPGMAKRWTKRCLLISSDVGQEVWAMNATVLLGKIAVLEKDMVKASKLLNQALEVSLRLNEKGTERDVRRELVKLELS